MKTNRLIIAAALAALALSGCAQTDQQQRTGTGALIGAGAGALAGQAIGRDTKSTVIGAASGALLGAVIGSASTPPSRNEEQMCRYRDYDTGRIFVAPCDDRYYN